jgi:hypothetical protein
MASKRVEAYRTVLYLSKFIVDESLLQSLADKLPRLLTALHVQNEDIRVGLIDRVQLVLKDLQELELGDGTLQQLSQSSKRFIKTFVVLLGVLVNLTAYKRLIVNLLKYKKLDSLVDLETVKYLTKTSLGVSSLVSFIPTVQKVLRKSLPTLQRSLPLATVLTTFASTSVLPEGYSKDYVALYSLAYGLESYLNYINDRFDLNVQSSWFLLPISLGELCHNYIIHPQFFPKNFKPVFDWFLVDLFESKPKILTVDYKWPTIDESLLKIRELSIERTRLKINRTLIASRVGSKTEITKYLPNPLHTLKVLSITNPSNPSLISVLLNYIPRKFVIFSLILFPLSYLKNLVTDHLSKNEDPDSTKKALLNAIKTSLKFSLISVLTTSTIFTLTTLNEHYARSPIRNLRFIGALSSLWFVLLTKHENFSKPILTFLTRASFLGTKKKLEFKYGKNSSMKYLNPSLASIGLGLLTALYERDELRRYISPNRLEKYLRFLSTTS